MAGLAGGDGLAADSLWIYAPLSLILQDKCRRPAVPEVLWCIARVAVCIMIPLFLMHEDTTVWKASLDTHALVPSLICPPP